MSHKKFIFFTLVALSIFLACKPRNQTDAQLKHTFGMTSVPRKNPPISCKNMGTDSHEGRYATALIDYITSKNPTTFTGNLSRKYICVQILQLDDLNASMDASSGTMRFFKRILHRLPGLETDAAKAATVAHELAHFTMSHHLANRESAPSGYDRKQEQVLRAQVDHLKEQLDAAKLSAINDFLTAENNEVSRTIDQVTGNSLLVKTMKSASFPKSILQAQKSFLEKPDLGNAENLLLEIDTWIVEADKYAGIHVTPLTPQQTRLIKSVLSRRESIREPNEDLNKKLWAAQEALETHRLPILQFQEQEADEVGFELFIRAGFDPDIFPQSFIHLAKAVRPSYECDPVSPLSPEPSRYREGISFNKVHPDICWRYWDTKYIERRKHASDYQPYITKKPILNLPALDQLRANLD